MSNLIMLVMQVLGSLFVGHLIFKQMLSMSICKKNTRFYVL
jgi:hypothetical protein